MGGKSPIQRILHFHLSTIFINTHISIYLIPTFTMGSIAIEDHVAKPSFPMEATTLEYAKSLDAKDHMRSFREKFIIPSKSNMKTKKLMKPGMYRNTVRLHDLLTANRRIGRPVYIFLRQLVGAATKSNFRIHSNPSQHLGNYWSQRTFQRPRRIPIDSVAAPCRTCIKTTGSYCRSFCF